MTAQPTPFARSRLPLLQAVRAFSMLLVATALASACHDGDAPTPPTAPRADTVNTAPSAQSSAAPLAQRVSAAPTATIAILASPAKPLKQAGAVASPADAPLLPPVIHTVD